MNETDWMADRFQEHRPHLRAVAYRMLGSLSEADDALQEAWLRLDRSDTSDVENLRAWLTTVVARICLNALRSRKSRREESIDVRVAEPIVTSEEGVDPEYEALLADSVGLAMLVVLEQLAPAERLAFVLHDMFAVPFDEIAPMVGRSPDAARQLASRARRRVQGARPEPDADPAEQRRVVDAFFAAAREGDFEALVAVLDPDVVLHSDGGPRLSGAHGHGPRGCGGRRPGDDLRVAGSVGAPGTRQRSGRSRRRAEGTAAVGDGVHRARREDRRDRRAHRPRPAEAHRSERGARRLAALVRATPAGHGLTT